MPYSKLGPPLDATCETIILEFERSRDNENKFDLGGALNGIAPEFKPRLVAELACIDLERRCDAGQLPRISPIVAEFPSLFECSTARTVVAIEHIRLCNVLGNSVDRNAIAKIYNVDVLELPEKSRCIAGEFVAHDSDFPVAGDTFCNYPLIAELGRGALARVYLAQQPDLAQRLVVLKVTQKPTAEADKLASLQHTGIIPVYSIHKQGELTCICMPYLGALTLANLIDDGRLLSRRTEQSQGLVSTIVAKRLSTIVGHVASATEDSSISDDTHTKVATVAIHANGNGDGTYKPLSADSISDQLGTAQLIESLNTHFIARGPIAAAVDLITKITDALAYAHQRSIVHHDLKPENILVANDGQPILLDFNLAASMHDRTSEITGGTLPYMSAQHLRSLNTNSPALASDDVFSVGVLLYQLLTGELPFTSTPFALQDTAKLANNRAKPPVHPRALNPAIPPSLAAIVCKCLAFEASERYPSAVELAEDLNRFQSDRPLRFAADRSIQERVRKWVRRHPLVTSNSSLLIGLGLIIGLLVVALTLSRSRAEAILTTQKASSLPAEVSAAITLLQSPGREPTLLREGLAAGEATIDNWIADDRDGVRLRTAINRLDISLASEVSGQLQKLLSAMLSASAQLSISKTERNLTHSRDAIDESKLRLMLDVVRSRSRTAFDASNADDLFLQALNARDEQKYEHWESLADRLVETQPTDPSQWFTLGAARWTLGDYQGARHAFDVASKLQSSSVIAVFWRGVCDLQQGNPKAASEDFSRCLELRPEWVPALYNRALATRSVGENEQALADLKKIISLKQATTRVYSLCSQIESFLGNQTAAQASIKLAIEAEPRDSDDLVARGMLLLRSDATAAMRDFESAYQQNPTNIAAIQNMAHIQSEVTHDDSAAMQTLTELTRLRPNIATPVASRGIIFGRNGQFEAALEDASRAEVLSPNALEMLQIAGIYSLACDQNLDRKERAIAWLAKAIASNPLLRSVAANDPDLVNVRDMEQFRTLTELPSERTQTRP